MQALRSLETDLATPVGLSGLGVRVLLVSSEAGAAHSAIAQRLAGIGGTVEVAPEIYAALSQMIDDSGEHGLFVMDCDSFGGLEAGRRAVAMMAHVTRPVPCLLISRECQRQEFPEEWHDPVVLRAPVSAVALRVGMEHALRGRLMWHHA